PMLIAPTVGAGRSSGPGWLWRGHNTFAQSTSATQAVLANGALPIVGGVLGDGLEVLSANTNLFTNPSFESDLSECAAENGGVMSRITTDAATGSACLLVTSSVLGD